jgi:hypothetical protein
MKVASTPLKSGLQKVIEGTGRRAALQETKGTNKLNVCVQSLRETVEERTEWNSRRRAYRSKCIVGEEKTCVKEVNFPTKKTTSSTQRRRS